MVYGNYDTVSNGRVYTARLRGEREGGSGGEVRAATLDVAAPTADRSPIDPSLPRRSVLSHYSVHTSVTCRRRKSWKRELYLGPLVYRDKTLILGIKIDQNEHDRQHRDISTMSYHDTVP